MTTVSTVAAVAKPLTGYRKTWKQATAAYATYKTVKLTATQMMNQFGHQLSIDEDYSNNTHATANRLAFENQVRLPGQRQQVIEHEARRQQGKFTSLEWTWINLPDVVPALQAKTSVRGDIMHFRVWRAKDLDALRSYLDQLTEEEDQVKVRKDIFDFDEDDETEIMAWDNKNQMWGYRKSRTIRTFKSVFLPAELQTAIEEDLDAFTSSKDRLKRLEMPWRRGYLLSGPPGTGKTSLALALAGKLGFAVASLSLTDIKSDAELKTAISQLRRHSVVVIEDIDAYSVSHDRDHKAASDGELSLSGLLNALDGFETPEGMLFVATSNYPEKLDEALTRNGRMDRHFTVDYIQPAELERLFQWFYEAPVPFAAPVETFDAKISPAEVAELFKQHLNDGDAGWAAAVAEIDRRLVAAWAKDEEVAA